MLDNQPFSSLYNPQLCSREYGVNLYIDEGTKDIQRVQFNARVQYCGEYENFYSIFHLFKENLILNGNLADEHSFKLAVECSKVFYPVTILTNNKGVIKALRKDNILTRWKEQRIKIEHYFKGDTTRQYIEATESALHSSEKINRIIDSDLFFSQYFRFQYVNQYNSDGIRFDSQLYLAPFAAPQEFSCRQFVDNNSSQNIESDNFTVFQEGSIGKEYIVEELFPQKFIDAKLNKQKVEGSFEVAYNLQKANNVINSIIGSFNLHQGNNKLLEIKLTAYHIAEKTVEPDKDPALRKLAKMKNNQSSFIGRTLDYLFN